MLKFIQKVLGSKQSRDIKYYEPYIQQINDIYEELFTLTNDELRNKTIEFREQITDYLKDIDDQIASVQQQALDETNLLEKEELFKEVDKIKEERDKQLEVVLKDLLPEAFAVVKETARRFSENEVLEVTATDHDRELAAQSHKSYVKIVA